MDQGLLRYRRYALPNLSLPIYMYIYTICAMVNILVDGIHCILHFYIQFSRTPTNLHNRNLWLALYCMPSSGIICSILLYFAIFYDILLYSVIFDYVLIYSVRINYFLIYFVICCIYIIQYPLPPYSVIFYYALL